VCRPHSIKFISFFSTTATKNIYKKCSSLKTTIVQSRYKLHKSEILSTLYHHAQHQVLFDKLYVYDIYVYCDCVFLPVNVTAIEEIIQPDY